MSITIQFRRGTTAQNMAHTGAAGSITVDTELNTLRIHDGVTPGGHIVSDAAAISDLQDQIDALGIADIDGLTAALAGKVGTDQLGVASGVATLDATGRVPSGQLPSYVDDVLEFADFASLPEEGETGKIFITLDDNKVYRWSGSAYIEIVAAPGSTDAVVEGTNNLYFTAARARAAISVSGDLSYDSETGVISFTETEVTAESIGLGAVQNYGIASEADAVAAESNEKYMTPLRTRNFVESIGFSQDGDTGEWTLDLGTLPPAE